MRKLILFTMSVLLTCWTPVLAAPAAPGEFLISDSDGNSFEAKMHGDEFQNWLEATGSGHTVMLNNVTNHWEYAQKNPDGTLTPSGIRVDPTGLSAPASIERGIKPPRDLEKERRHDNALKRVYHKRQPPYSLPDTGLSGQTSYDPGSTYDPGSSLPADVTPEPVSGTRKLLVVLVSFADRDIVTHPSAWSDAIFKTSGTSVARYYLDNSFGKLSIIPVSHSQPGQPDGVVSVKLTSVSSVAESTWVAEAINAVAADPINVDFSALDADKDGIIDRDEAVIYFIAAGYEQSTRATKTPSVWGHATIYSSGGGLSAAGKLFPVYAMNGELNAADHQMTTSR